MYLHNWGDRIPILRELILLTNNVLFAHRHLDITIFNQAKRTPYANTERCASGLNSQTIAEVQKNEMATTEDLLNVDSCC